MPRPTVTQSAVRYHCAKLQSRSFTDSRSILARPADTKPSRRAITLTTDDGRHAWNELSTGEKVVRSTQQSFNFALVSAGAIGTVSCSQHCLIYGN